MPVITYKTTIINACADSRMMYSLENHGITQGRPPVPLKCNVTGKFCKVDYLCGYFLFFSLLFFSFLFFFFSFLYVDLYHVR